MLFPSGVVDWNDITNKNKPVQSDNRDPKREQLAVGLRQRWAVENIIEDMAPLWKAHMRYICQLLLHFLLNPMPLYLENVLRDILNNTDNGLAHSCI